MNLANSTLFKSLYMKVDNFNMKCRLKYCKSAFGYLFQYLHLGLTFYYHCMLKS